MKLLRTTVVLIACCALLGCSTTSPNPELGMSRRGVGVSGQDVDELRRSLVLFIGEQDYELADSDRRTLDFDRLASKWASMRYGSFVNPETFIRMKVIIMEVGASDYWVSFEPLIVTERGSGFEAAKPLKGSAAREMQSILESWKLQLSEG